MSDPRWTAVANRDRSADGRFVYAVRTTGVYCRPSCPARRPLPANVSYFETPDAAEQAGFRACKRCRPQATDARAGLVAGLCRLIERSDSPPSLAELAAHAGLSRHHVHRVFRAVTGVTPGAYAAATRARRVRESLDTAPSVTAAIYDAGYNSSGRFYEESGRLLGMTPSAWRAGGAGATIRFAVGRCSLGEVLVAQSAIGVCAILLGDDADVLARDLQDRFPNATLLGGDGAFERTVATVVAFVEAPQVGLALPLDIRGTAFQRRVWEALLAVPAGETVTYSELAGRLGLPKAARAVAGACAANPLAVAVPCHRVVRTDGGLAGYRWGIERKRALLRREAH